MRALRSVFFCEPSAHGDMYRRLARVLEHTAHKHCSDWDVLVEEVTDPGRGDVHARQSFVWNTRKLRWWHDRVIEAPDGAEVLLIDADMAILKPLDDAWAIDFDIAYTVRDVGLPLNGGVVFVRVSDRTRRFVDQWWETNLRFFNDPEAHAPWRAKYAGMNQASFGYVLEEVDHGCDLVKLSCREWNCVKWTTFDRATTRVLHVKSKLRRLTFGVETVARPAPYVKYLIDLWHSLEREARDGRGE